MKALIYCRVSSQRQVDEGNGLESQEQRCRNFAEMKKYEIEKVFLDEGISGGLFERPAMQDLISYLDSYPFEKFVVIFDDLSRFARDVKVHLQLKALFASRGVKLECLNFSFDDSEESEFAELVLAVSNQYQRKSNRRQVIQKQKARLDNGYWPFDPPTGLRNQKDLVHGKILVPVEPYASILKKTIEKYRDGEFITLGEVKQYLHEAYELVGLPNRPSLSTTIHILNNPLYAGYLEYPKWKVPFKEAKHKGFISVDTYYLVQERLQGRAKPWKRKDYSNDFPLRPYVLCKACGKPLTASWNKGRSKSYPNYSCKTKGCVYNWKSINKTKIENEFEVLLSQSKPLNQHLDLARAVLQEQWNIRVEQYTKVRETKEKELKELKDGIQGYVERVPKVDDSLAAMYEDKIKELQKKQAKAETDLKKEPYSSEAFGIASEKVFNTLKNPLIMWQSDNFNDKRAILFMYFEENLEYDYNLGFGTVNLTRPIGIINELGQANYGNVEMSGIEPESKKNFLKLLQA